MNLVWDIEADNFFPYATKTWVVVIKSTCGAVNEKLYPFRDCFAGQKLMNIVNDGDTMIGHNILGYDFFVIMKTMGVTLDIITKTLTLNGGMSKKIEIIDTLCLSRFVNPDSQQHSLEFYGKKLGYNKIDFHEFDKFSEEMVVYCERDVDLNILVFSHLMRVYKKLYNTEEVTRPFWNYQVDHYLMSAQGFTGVLFDRLRAIEVKESIAIDMEEIRARIEPQLPAREMNKGEQKVYTMPKKPYKGDGSVAKVTENWVEKMIGLGHDCKLEYHEKGDEYTIMLDGDRFPLKSEFIIPRKVPMTLSNQAQLKEWFLDLGWKPTFWNYKKDSNGKFERTDRGQLIPTTPKLQEQGKLCPNLDLLEIDIAKDVVKWLSLRNRHSVVGNWIDNPRLDIDGRLSSSSTGTTPTYRHKHTEVVNVPKAQVGVLYGKEFRSLFIVPTGRKMVGADAAGLEARVDGHYCVPMTTLALSRNGWVTYDQLNIGDEILAYCPKTNTKVWSKLLDKVHFKDESITKISGKSFSIRCTPNHRWYVSQRDTTTNTYSINVVKTKDLNTTHSIIVNAPMFRYPPDFHNTDGFYITRGKYHIDWVKKILDMTQTQRCAWLEGFMVADGHYSNPNASRDGVDPTLPQKGTWKWAQNVGEHFEAALTATYLVHDGKLPIQERGKLRVVTLSKSSTYGVNNLMFEDDGVEDVWCPVTEHGTWVMRQGDCITITGNCAKHDNGVRGDIILNGDIHSRNAKLFYPSETTGFDPDAPDFDKEHPDFKPYRSRSKNAAYALAYGCGVKKLAETLGKPEGQAQELYDAFWDGNPALKAVKQACEGYWKKYGKKYLLGIDGRLVFTRKQSALVNSLFQSCGAIIMSYAGEYMNEWLGGLKFDDNWLPYYEYKGHICKRVLFMHDEYQYECDEEIAEEVGQMVVDAIIKAGEDLHMRLELGGDFAIGNNWAETH